MKKLLIGGLVALISAFGFQGRPVTDINIRHGSGQVYQVSRHEGERQLTVLATYVNKEDFWLFYNGRWTDIGINESKSGVGMDTLLYEKIIEEIPAGSTIYDYHIHPSEGVYELSPPSTKDVISHKWMAEELRQRNIILISKAVTSLGAWEYSTDSIFHQLVYTHHGEISPGGYACFVIEAGVNNRVASDITHEDRETILEYMRKMKDVGIILKYTTFDSTHVYAVDECPPSHP